MQIRVFGVEARAVQGMCAGYQRRRERSTAKSNVPLLSETAWVIIVWVGRELPPVAWRGHGWQSWS